jgi:hypothetical protein
VFFHFFVYLATDYIKKHVHFCTHLVDYQLAATTAVVVITATTTTAEKKDDNKNDNP